MNGPEDHVDVRDSSRELGPLVRLALPLIVVNVGHQMMGLVDTALAGRVDKVAQAAVGLGNTIFFLGAIVGMGVVMGVDPIASQALGAGQARRARRAMWHGVVTAVLATLPVALAVLALGMCLEVFGIGRELAESTRDYVTARLPSLMALMLVVAQRAYLQAAHRTAPIVTSTIIVNVFNFAADWVLIFGDAGLIRLGLPGAGIPAMGVVGVGWASTGATFLQLFVLAWAVRRIDPGGGAEPVRELDRPMLRRVFALGIPIGVQMLAEMGMFSLVGMMAGTMGIVAMAAHQVALMLAAFAFMVPLAVGTATSVQVGRAIGRSDAPGTRRAGLTGVGLGGAFMLLSALAMWIFPGALARIMTDDPEVAPLAAALIRIAGAFQIFDGIQVTASGALRGAGMTRFAMRANILSYWVVGLPVAVLLGLGMDLGPQGLWWGLTAGLALAAAILTGRFLSVSRKPIAAVDPA